MSVKTCLTIQKMSCEKHGFFMNVVVGIQADAFMMFVVLPADF